MDEVKDVDVNLRYNEVPDITCEQLDRVLRAATVDEHGCLVRSWPPGNPGVIVIDGRPYQVTRVVWANFVGREGLDTHEVIHRPCCKHPGGRVINEQGVFVQNLPVCIEPSHLELGDPKSCVVNSVKRGTKFYPPPRKRRECEHDPSERNQLGCRVCRALYQKQYNLAHPNRNRRRIQQEVSL